MSYESNTIKKVYWVDGKNPFRMLNLDDKPVPEIVGQNDLTSVYYNDVFNVLPTLKLQETVYIDKITGGSGKFASGVIQYAFTYYNRHGCESNIFYTSGLRYISPIDRGGAPDEMVDNAFKIRIEKVDTRFDYVRIYSIQRTIINGTPICKRITDIDIVPPVSGDLTITYIDTGTTGDIIDPSELFFKNRETIIASTLEQKDNTLFLGNIKKDTSFNIPNTIVLNHKLVNPNNERCTITTDFRSINMGEIDLNSPFSHVSQLNLYTGNGDTREHGIPCNGFKIGNTYRLGFQLQDKTGRWSDPIYIDDYEVQGIGTVPGTGETDTRKFHPEITSIINAGVLRMPRITATIDTTTSGALIDCGYRKVRPVIVVPTIQERKTICQGVVNPTVYTNNGRNDNNSNYGQSSWFFRPIPFKNTNPDNGPVFTSSDDQNPSGYFSKFTVDLAKSAEDEYWTSVASPRSNNNTPIPYTDNSSDYNPRHNKRYTRTGEGYPYDDESFVGNDIKTTEIQGYYAKNNKFKVDWRLLTLHSPDIELTEELYNSTFLDTDYRYVGTANFVNTLSDINIQTTSPQIDGSASGIIHKSYTEEKSYGIVAGLFYEDAVVRDKSSEKIESFIDANDNNAEKVPCKWIVYPWHRSGSINNDFNRPSGTGVQSAYLKKKAISNLRFANTSYKLGDITATAFSKTVPQLYIGQNNIIKLKIKEDAAPYNYKSNAFYYGTVDSLLIPDKISPLFYAFAGEDYNSSYGEVYDEHAQLIFDFHETNIGSRRYWKAWKFDYSDTHNHGLYKFNITNPTPVGEGADAHWGNYNPSDSHTLDKIVPNTDKIGGTYSDLVRGKDAVRMRYKSTSHMVIYENSATAAYDSFPYDSERGSNFFLPIYEIQRNSITNIFGGTSLDALKANVWIVCGKEEHLKNTPINSTLETVFHFDYGDNYYQRYDCLKTYAYSFDDINQVVEIGSFMLEGYNNIEGRYDKNRGQVNNTNVSPENFNLINPVYSQVNNFFSYKIIDDTVSASNTYINYLTWSFPKVSGEDIDTWTYLTLANTLELEGDKGQLNYIKRFKNQLLAFQDLAVSQILYNENVQITSTEGVPIEIANSGKVEGFRYLSTSIGCSNKWSIVETPEGLYFMDSVNKAIYIFNEGFSNISAAGGFSSWSTQNIAGIGNTWTPTFKRYQQQFGSNTLSPFVSYYDALNHEVLFINADTALAWNERMKAFTSFYNYEDTPYFTSLGDFQLWLRSSVMNNNKYITAWHHQAGEETCNFFGNRKPYWMTLVGNPEPQTDKMFTNLEFRACVEGDGTWSGTKFTPTLPFNNLEVWNEYQHGIAILQNSQGHDEFQHHSTDDNNSSLKRKFRIWRCDIPRDNAMVNPLSEAPRGIFREKCHPISRIRNPWVYLNIKKTPIISYTCVKVPGTKGFIIPISEFVAYHNETGLDYCDIRANELLDPTDIALHVLYSLVDMTTMDVKYNYDEHFYYQIPLTMCIVDSETPTNGIIAKAAACNADGLFVDCSTWNFDPTTIELTIGRTLALTRTEIHDLALTYYN